MGGLIVVATSFFATMQLLDYWWSPPDPNANVIHVTEATYGLSCKDFREEPPRVNLVKLGNATKPVAQACEGTKSSCLYAIDVNKIGDPADGCGKDFVANWRCGGDSKVHQFYLAAEASGRSVLFSCPAP